MINKTNEYLQSIVRELSKLPTEIEWVEFKCNYEDCERIAKYISGLSNAALLAGRPCAYMVWGILDETHEIVGTQFDYRKAKKGNEELEAWLARMINPKVNFKFYNVDMWDDTKVVLLEIPCADSEPTKYGSVGYIRVGTNLKPLLEYKEKERELWQAFNNVAYELRNASENRSEDDVLMILDYPKYYEKQGLPIPHNIEKIFEDFLHDKFVRRNDAGTWDVTNLGTLMIGKDLRKFEHLARKTVRVIKYKGNDRLTGIREKEFVTGYAVSHEEIVEYIMAIIPQEEVLEGTIRKSKVAFPEIAIRELLANIMIHQMLNHRGTNPMVEIFDNRIEFSNAGAPLISIEHIVDTVPVSRNENMAGFMHRCGICEERGSGYDKIIRATSSNELIAPKVINQDGQFTKAVLFAKIPFELTSKEDRIRTCYMQACLAYVEFETISNSDVREIFGIDSKDSYKSSRIIKDTIDAGLIKAIDPDTAPRYMKYIPFWA